MVPDRHQGPHRRLHANTGHEEQHRHHGQTVRHRARRRRGNRDPGRERTGQAERDAQEQGPDRRDRLPTLECPELGGPEGPNPG